MDNFESSVRKNSSSGIGLAMIVAALLFVIGPQFLPSLPAASKFLLSGFGVALAIVGGILITITKLYCKASSDEAFVRTGMGGAKAIVDGGAIVIPVVHAMVPVSLKTMRLDVERKGQEALITGDNLRADVSAEFYIKIQKKSEDVLSAATSLGNRSTNQKAVMDLVFHKLVSALRTVAATMPLNELNIKRDDFAGKVHEIVKKELEPNGLTLESVTVSSLDQTSLEFLKSDTNVFDAQGAKRIAEITQEQKVEKNKLERDAEKKIKEQDVEKEKFVYLQEVQRSQAEAERISEIAKSKAEADKKSKTFQAEQDQLVQKAQIDSEKAVKLAAVMKEQEIEVQEQRRQQAAQQAEIERAKTVELAQRDKEISITEKERERADVEAQRFAAEAEREKEHQKLLTVEAEQTAEREKIKQVVAQKASTEKMKIENEANADVAAYARIKEADAEQTAATKKADAMLKIAEATKQSKVLEADGEQATQLVPVNVKKAEVDVHKAQVEVDRQDLQNKAEFQAIAKELQIQLATIAADKEAKIAAAKAFGEALAKANVTLWGDPKALTTMSEAFYSGQKNGYMADGLLSSLPEEIREHVSGVVEAGTALLNKAAKSPKNGSGLQK